MNSTEYTGGIIDSGRIKRLFEKCLTEIADAKSKFNEKSMPFPGKVRGKDFVILQTNLISEDEVFDEAFKGERKLYNVRFIIDTDNDKDGIKCALEGTKKKNGTKFVRFFEQCNQPISISEALESVSYKSPREIMRILRRLEAVRDWYIARRKGQERGANEILKQQDKWVKALENELAMESLKE